MVDYEIWLDGVSNKEAGIVMQGAVEISPAVPRVESVEIPGRNGDLHFWDGSYENRTATVGAYVYQPDFVKTAFSRVNQWLLSSVGYRKLATDDDAEHYMLARVVNSAEIAARIRRIAPFEIEFDCKPQRFLTIGDESIIINKNKTIENPTIFASKPLYKINGSGAGVLTIGSYSLSISSIDGYVHYDAETQTAYKGTVNKNSTINAPDGLPFEGGEQPINFSGGITSVEIIPRWWEL
jgi:phage-related protein